MPSIYYRITPVKQTTSNTCWLASGAMLLSWRNGKIYDELAAAKQGGKKFEEMLSRGEAINYDGIMEFAENLKFKSGPMQCLSSEGLSKLLADKGPIWVAGIINDGSQFYGHIRVIVGITVFSNAFLKKFLSDSITYIDPADGSYHTKDFNVFMNQYEGAVIDQFNTVPVVSNSLMFTTR